MNDIFNDETFLARWLDNGLTPEEMESFRKHPHFQQYTHIIMEAELLDVQYFDKEAVLTKLKTKRNISANDSKLFHIDRRIFIAAAATFLLLITGYFTYFPNDLKFLTGFGEQLVVTLPDGSSITLNSKSAISYKKKTFSKQRTLKLEGEAYFDVEQGNDFIVETRNGTIKVLGTSFNVLSRQDILKVACKTGKVSVENAGGDLVILKAGNQVRVENEKMGSIEKIPMTNISKWIEGESKFESVPLSDVIMILESYYGVTIKIDNTKAGDNFTGGFPHNDLRIALKTVFTPMGLNFEIKNDGIIVIR